MLCPSTHLSTASLPHPKERGGKEEKRNLGHVIIWRSLSRSPPSTAAPGDHSSSLPRCCGRAVLGKSLSAAEHRLPTVTCCIFVLLLTCKDFKWTLFYLQVTQEQSIAVVLFSEPWISDWVCTQGAQCYLWSAVGAVWLLRSGFQRIIRICLEIVSANNLWCLVAICRFHKNSWQWACLLGFSQLFW